MGALLPIRRWIGGFLWLIARHSARQIDSAECQPAKMIGQQTAHRHTPCTAPVPHKERWEQPSRSRMLSRMLGSWCRGDLYSTGIKHPTAGVSSRSINFVFSTPSCRAKSNCETHFPVPPTHLVRQVAEGGSEAASPTQIWSRRFSQSSNTYSVPPASLCSACVARRLRRSSRSGF
jgi:hypothetical protein